LATIFSVESLSWLVEGYNGTFETLLKLLRRRVPDLVVYIGMSLTFFTVLSAGSVLLFRRSRPGWQKLGAVSFAYPLAPLSYVLVGTGMMLYGFIWQPKASVSAMATVAAGALVYRFAVRRKPL
jgi:hypothetical protein